MVGTFRTKLWEIWLPSQGLSKRTPLYYYPQANGQVEAVNKSLKSILQRTITESKNNWNIMLYPNFWAYRTVIKTATNFSAYQLVHGVESVLPVECETLL